MSDKARPKILNPKALTFCHPPSHQGPQNLLCEVIQLGILCTEGFGLGEFGGLSGLSGLSDLGLRVWGFRVLGFRVLGF